MLGEPDTKRINYFLDSSFKQVAMRTDKMEFNHIRSLRQISAEVFREMSVTGATRKEISKTLLERAMQIPGFEFTDKAGTKWQAKSYFSMLARTELMNASRECYDDKMTEEGFDVMRLTVSGDPCDSCSKYENRLFSLTGATAGLPTKADLEAAGVFHPNCTHTYVMVPDFIRERDYNADGTRKQAENVKSFVRQFNPEPEDNTKRFNGVFESDAAKRFDKKLRESKLDNAQVDEFNFNMQKAGHLLQKEPEFGFDETAHTDIVNGTVFVSKGHETYNGCRNAIAHEFGEHLFVSFLKSGKGVDKFHKVIQSDRKILPEIIVKSKGLNFEQQIDLQTQHSKSILNKDFGQLTADEQHRVLSFFDVSGSISGGEYGFGHNNYLEEIAEDRFGNDAFACMYSAVIHGYKEYQDAYPELWKFISKYLSK